MKDIWIGTSWKMNKTLADAMDFAGRLATAQVDPRVQAFVIPPFTAVREVAQILADTPVKVGAQTMHWADAGAWTGEISPPMLVDCGLDLVELGHSERRTHFGETDETVGLKAEAAIRHGLIPLICIGEDRAAMEAGESDAVLRRQVEAAFAPLSDDQRAAPTLLAYEPVWAIGEHGIPATPDYAEDRHGRLAELATELAGRHVPCLYGGSVNPDNCADLIAQPHIDGLFIGRSAWMVDGYLDIIDRCTARL